MSCSVRTAHCANDRVYCTDALKRSLNTMVRLRAMGEQKLSMLRIGYDAASVPEGGSVVVSSVATFTKTVNKEPAGSGFHTFALRQAGVYGAHIAAGSGTPLSSHTASCMIIVHSRYASTMSGCSATPWGHTFTWHHLMASR